MGFFKAALTVLLLGTGSASAKYYVDTDDYNQFPDADPDDPCLFWKTEADKRNMPTFGWRKQGYFACQEYEKSIEPSDILKAVKASLVDFEQIVADRQIAFFEALRKATDEGKACSQVDSCYALNLRPESIDRLAEETGLILVLEATSGGY